MGHEYDRKKKTTKKRGKKIRARDENTNKIIKC
jgi:hypothetical protein